MEIRAGRLIEVRIFSLLTCDDLDAHVAQFGALLRHVPKGVRPVLCADHRSVELCSEEVAERLGEAFAVANASLERIAVLVAPTNIPLAMQLERLVRKAGNPHRKVCYLAGFAANHLAPVLSQREQARLREFLAE
jgi:hypothetical protein